jgi:ABC-2 type transport system ATP-binding protein
LEELVVTEGLTKTYGEIRAVDGLNLNVHSGEVFGFLGPNGAGKTTTIRILNTLTKPTSGGAWVNGFDVVKEAGRVKKVIGVVQQHISLDRDLTVRENMEFHARLHHLGTSERKRRINELIDYVGLTEHADRIVEQLSGGMKRRAMIVNALLHQPEVLFLDEPTVGLDAQTRRRLWDLIRRLNRDGVTIFLTTHYIEEAEALSARGHNSFRAADQRRQPFGAASKTGFVYCGNVGEQQGHAVPILPQQGSSVKLRAGSAPRR